MAVYCGGGSCDHTTERKKVMAILRNGHPGMKRIMRNAVWWPGVDADIERKVKSCVDCQVNQGSPARAPLHPWEWPSRPWSRLHIYRAGPFMGKMFLVVVDAYSKWLNVKMVPSANSSSTVTVLRSLFATHRLPELIASDNGTAFTSEEFSFLRRNEIRHVTSAP